MALFGNRPATQTELEATKRAVFIFKLGAIKPEGDIEVGHEFAYGYSLGTEAYYVAFRDLNGTYVTDLKLTFLQAKGLFKALEWNEHEQFSFDFDKVKNLVKESRKKKRNLFSDDDYFWFFQDNL